MDYVIKAAIADPHAESFTFADQKTMYGGKAIRPGDTLYLFASGTGWGRGLVAKGLVTAAEPTPPFPGVARQTPRISVTVRRVAPAVRPLDPCELEPFADRDDGPEKEIYFKFYRQATDKIAGVSIETARFLDGFL